MAPKTYKEWAKPLLELEEALGKLRSVAGKQKDEDKRGELEAQISEFEDRRDRYLKQLYTSLGPWEKVLLARAETRPYMLDYVQALFTDFVELSGDRLGHVDNAIIGGPANLEGRPVMIIGHQKGRNIQERTHRNFAMAKPEGYRKAMRLMDMADRFGMPVIEFVDTPAADPGVESEERGISEAIASCMLKQFELGVPILSVIIGEGGSGGAIGIACGNRVAMMEYAIYSVIPPEGCAAILWRSPEKGPEAARALRLTAQGALEYEAIDDILDEPFGGAHRDPVTAAETVGNWLKENLRRLDEMSPEELRRQRRETFRNRGRAGAALERE
ncbi:MAG: acetyl-CoA carboxylase carboxyltransferase subunit alpha [Fimbriimonadaceae bacterium]